MHAGEVALVAAENVHVSAHLDKGVADRRVLHVGGNVFWKVELRHHHTTEIADTVRLPGKSVVRRLPENSGHSPGCYCGFGFGSGCSFGWDLDLDFDLDLGLGRRSSSFPC